MDPVSAAELREFLENSNARLTQQDEQIVGTGRAVQALVSQVSELTSQLQHLQMEPTQQPTAPNPPAVPDASRLPSATVYSAFGREATRILLELRQAHRTVTDYSIEFRTLAAECKWNTEAQWDMFLHGLAPYIQYEIYALDLPPLWMNLLIWRFRFRAYADGPILSLSKREREMKKPWIVSVLQGGWTHGCPVSSKSWSPPIQWDSDTYSCEALIDSGAEGNFLDFNLARKLKVPVFVLKNSISVIALSVLGHPWLTLHKPHINWGHDSDEHLDLSNVPVEYLDLKRVFSKSCFSSSASSLRLCYGFIASITVKNTYPLLLMSSAFERLQGASFFTKLDLRNTYHLEHVQHVRRVLQRLLENGLHVKVEKCVFHAQSVPFLGYIMSAEGVRMDPDKVKAVVDWPIPDSCKPLQRFLGFANFYRHFIRNFSQLASPLTALTSTKTAFRWSNTADVAFTKLKDCFVSAQILIAPDPSRQFVVEVDASEEGVGPVLSQRFSSDDRLHPCAFFSHCLSPVECNYDIGSKNIKPDALSRMFDHSKRSSSPEPILPQKVVISVVAWEIESKVCTASEGTASRPSAGLLPPLLVPSRPGSSALNMVVLTVVDRFSKATHFIPLPKLPSARETGVAVIDHVFRIHGLPTDVVSDRGPQFVSKFWKEFSHLLGATVSLSSGFHPQSNVQTERANQDLEHMLRCLVSHNPSSWSQQLSWVEYAHNSLPVSATGLSPFECSLGYQPPVFPSTESEVAVPPLLSRGAIAPGTEPDRPSSRWGRAPRLRPIATGRSPPVYVVGQKVWLSSKNISLCTVCNKLAPKFIGLFTVTKIISPVAVRLKLPPAYRRIHPIFHVSKLKPIFHSAINLPVPVPPPSRLVDGEPVYSVKCILDSRQRGQGFQYLVDWESYGPEERSWCLQETY
ncbi:Transposon Tf2-8 polyprotein [Labeo rohita]|uniref:Transposon Tf2-8 polyprotein n=1 Tax=Labeo rohita TaxID=84645 RepID=A0ABQ8MMS7_LABRO|nr:Transposon Tf2-8 polyprotein [Labeo rohita]